MLSHQSPLIAAEVNLAMLPVADAPNIVNENEEITIGDLHGNFIKLLYSLVKEGVVTQLTAEQYRKFLEIYHLPVAELTESQLRDFDALLATLKFNTNKKIRLIGDDLSDRGSNDIFTLKMIKQLKKNNVPTTVMLSNHTLEFVRAIEANKNFVSNKLPGPFSRSMANLQYLIDNKIVTRDEVVVLYDEFYRPNLKIIDYALSAENEITIFTHAGIPFLCIKEIATELGVDYSDSTHFQLAETIDKINQAFQELGNQGNMGAVCSRPLSSLDEALWNRSENIYRPDQVYNYRVKYVHGHNIPQGQLDHIYALDSKLGMPGLMTGKYLVHSTSSKPLVSQLHILSPSTRAMNDNLSNHQTKGITDLVTAISDLEKYGSKLGRTNLGDEVTMTANTLMSEAKKLQKGNVGQSIPETINNMKSTLHYMQAKFAVKRDDSLSHIVANVILSITLVGLIFQAINKYKTGSMFIFFSETTTREDLANNILSRINLVAG